MSFLWLTRFVPYPPRYGGDVTYTAKLLEHLSDIVPLDVLCYREHPDASVPERPGLTWHLLPWTPQARWRSVTSPLPNVAAQYRHPEFVSQMIALSEKAEAVILDHLGMAWCAEVLDKHFLARPGQHRPAMVFIPIDHNKSVRMQAARQASNLIMRQTVKWDAQKAMRLEDRAVRLVDGVVVLTERDQRLFERDHPEAKYLVLTPGYDGEVSEGRTIDATVPERICMLGGRGSFHKQIVLRQFLEALQNRPPPVKHIDIVGFMQPALKASLEARYPSLTFRGYVEDVAAYLRDVRLGIMPDAVGGGFKLRALTYMFTRVPILAVKGALDGMGFTPGEHYLEAPDLDSLVTLAGTAAADFPLLNHIANNAFNVCRERFDWKDRALALRDFSRAMRAGRQS